MSAALALAGSALLVPHAASHAATPQPALQLPWPVGVRHDIETGSSYGCGGHRNREAYAIDFNLRYEQVAAAAAGTAHVRSDGSGFGRYVWIQHGGGWVTLYGHLSSFAVADGQHVAQGQVIATSGSTGRSSGPHLHFRLTRDATGPMDGTPVPPEPMSGFSGFGHYGATRDTGCSGSRTSPMYLSRAARRPVATDVFAVAVAGRGSGRVEVHSFAQAQRYRAYDGHSVSALGTLDPADYAFVFGSWHGDGRRNLYALHLRHTRSGRVEVTVLSAASGYTKVVAFARTALNAVNPAQWMFGVSGLDSAAALYAIRLTGGASHRVEVHALTEASAYARWAFHSATRLGWVRPDQWQFGIWQKDFDGRGDLLAVQHAGNASGYAEVQVLSRASGYGAMVLHTRTPLVAVAGARVAWRVGDDDVDGIPDVYRVLFARTKSGRVEVTVLPGAASYRSVRLQAMTPLVTTAPGVWRFGAG